MTGLQFVAEVHWPTFGNTTTRAEGQFIGDSSTAGDDEVWRMIAGFDPVAHQVGLRLREVSFIQGNGVSLNVQYELLYRDFQTLQGAWRIPGSHGLTSLTLHKPS